MVLHKQSNLQLSNNRTDKGMEIDILSLFPDYFSSPLQTSILGKAIERKILDIRCRNIRDFGLGKWKQVDDVPFAGQGMLLQAEPVVQSIRSVKREGSRVVYLSPQGSMFCVEKAKELASYSHLVLLCGHYEGIDERALEEVDEEISIGDYVLTNGAIAALVVIDAVSRFVPGVLGNEESAKQDSLENGLLEGPQYTRPRVFEGKGVPEVLLQGDHRLIAQWRLEESLRRTARRRPDLYFRYMARHEGPNCGEDRSEESSFGSSVLLMVENINQTQTFYAKVFGRRVTIENSTICFLGKTPMMVCLCEAEEKTKQKATFFLNVGHFSDCLTVMKKWEKFGGTVEQHCELTGVITAVDLDGHTWKIVCK